MDQLEFENQVFVELLSEDGLIILARGLGLDRLFIKFLKLYSDPHNLVLVISTSSTHEQYFIEELTKQGVEYLPKSVTNEITSKERDLLYLKGGVLFITSRILVVDLLKKVCPLDKISGILVFNAHRATDSSTEAFIMRLYREGNKSGFIKGFSDSPESFMTGFCQLERIMKNLFVRHVYLWPRFHAVVNAALQRHKPDVVELRQQMTPNMTAVQLAILDIMKACVVELRNTNSTLDAESVTVENCLGKPFDQIIKLYLDPVWNELSYQTKQLVHDLKMLRTLLFFLTQYDCVTFYSYLESLRSSGATRAFADQTPWIFMEAANTLFVKSKERVFGNEKEGKTNEGEMSATLRLEESPKWHLLSLVLEEIEKEYKERIKEEGEDRNIVLIVANDYRTCSQLKQYLCDGGRKLLQNQFQRLLAHKHQISSTALPKEMQAQLRSKTTRGRGKGKGAGSRKGTDTEPAAKRIKMDDQLIIEEIEERENEEDCFAFQIAFKDIFQTDSRSLSLTTEQRVGNFELLPNPLIIIHALSSSSDPYHLTKVLRETHPHTIIMYDSDVKFVRQIEVYKAGHPGKQLRVYFLMYDSSVEEQKYLTSLRKEKEAFQQLIHQKGHMLVPADREGRNTDNVHLKRGEPQAMTSTSRKAGGRVEDIGPQMIIVDMREFRSSLPSLIHKRGIDIVPVTLEVGDYVLTPEICIERKSISDLIGSLNSGRLYNQATAMTRYYKRPILLIEFEEGKPFSLQSSGVITSSEVSSQSVASKLVLLTIYFPELRILWCPSPHATAELFEALKIGQSQPSAEIAATVGAEGEECKEQLYNSGAQDFLLKLPGINTKNYRFILENVKDFQELVILSEKKLEEILGNDVNAKLLWNCLHNKPKPPTITSHSTNTHRGRGKGRKGKRGQ